MLHLGVQITCSTVFYYFVPGGTAVALPLYVIASDSLLQRLRTRETPSVFTSRSGRQAVDSRQRWRTIFGDTLDLGASSKVYTPNGKVSMEGGQGSNGLRIGELARRAGTSSDTVRYYERVGLLGAVDRTASGYRHYSDAELGRLQFIRRAKLLGLSLEQIRGLLGVAEEGECQPLRRQVAQLLHEKLGECEARLAELRAFKASLEKRYELTLQHPDEPACSCATFPASCTCLPVTLQEVIAASKEADPHRGEQQNVSER